MSQRVLFPTNQQGSYFLKMLEPLISYMEDLTNEEISVRENYVTLIKSNKRQEIALSVLSKKYMETIITVASNMANRPLQKNNSICDSISFELPINKLRFTGILNSNALTFNIRLNDIIIYPLSSFALNEEEADFLISCIKHYSNIIVVGATSSGKTSFANSLLSYIDPNDNTLIIGDILDYITPGVQLYLPANNYEEVINRFDNAVRLTPKRILIPELKSYNSSAIFRTMNTGHNGFFTTIHASRLREGIVSAFIQNISAHSGNIINEESITKYINNNIDITLFIKKDEFGKRKITDIDIIKSSLLQEAKKNSLFGFNSKKLKTVKISKTPTASYQIKKTGRPAVYNPEKRYLIKMLFAKEKNITKVSQASKIPYTTVHRIINERDINAK